MSDLQLYGEMVVLCLVLYGVTYGATNLLGYLVLMLDGLVGLCRGVIHVFRHRS